MNNNLRSIKFFLYLLLILFAFIINTYYGNLGLFPIDSFSFFDTGYLILRDKYPIKDVWIISGIFGDYVQAAFFSLFGLKWSSYVYHASFFNVLISISFFYLLLKSEVNIYFSFLCSVSVATLCYPVSGTPFPYQHSFILSLISIFIFYLGIYSEEKKFWFILPFFMLISFLSMQMPASIINILIILFGSIFFYSEKKKSLFFMFFLGSLVTLIFLIIFLIKHKILIHDFVEQYIFFPLSIGSGRITGSEEAYRDATLMNKFTFRGIIGHFKFINIFLFGFMIIIFKKFILLKNSKLFFKDNLTTFFIVFCSISFIFHQLITANQTFIFSLIPILGGFFFIQVTKNYNKKYLKFLIILVILFATIKYHNSYNEKRKFMDLQHANLKNNIDASFLDVKLKGLKWITPSYSKNPKEEIEILKIALKKLKNDKREKMLITHYQFFSLLLEEDLNIPNRWYYPYNNTYPSSKKSSYFNSYKKRFNKKLKVNKIEVIYFIDSYPTELDINGFKKYLKEDCTNEEKINNIITLLELKNCF